MWFSTSWRPSAGPFRRLEVLTAKTRVTGNRVCVFTIVYVYYIPPTQNKLARFQRGFQPALQYEDACENRKTIQVHVLKTIYDPRGRYCAGQQKNFQVTIKKNKKITRAVVISS